MGTGGSSCNPSNSGGRDQEDCSSKPAQANSSRDPILKKTITKKKKRAGGVAQCVGPWVQVSVPQEKVVGGGDTCFGKKKRWIEMPEQG
jgi:hypothetical protein